MNQTLGKSNLISSHFRKISIDKYFINLEYYLIKIKTLELIFFWLRLYPHYSLVWTKIAIPTTWWPKIVIPTTWWTEIVIHTT